MTIPISPMRAALIVLVVALLAVPAAGEISGWIYYPIKASYPEMPVSANKIGELTDHGIHWSGSSTPVGYFNITPLGAGIYSLGFGEKDEWNRHLVFGVDASSGSASYIRRIDYPDYGTGKFWDGTKRTWWAQSFMATGSSIISVSIDCALEFGPDTTITIHANDPYGPQIGPARTVKTDINNPSAVFWSAGEVPTVPGQIYCARFTGGVNALMPFFTWVKVQNSSIYPDGKTWRDGVQVDTPMKTVIGQDDDGVTTTVSTSKRSLPSYAPGTAIGQTFTANGSSVLCVGVLAGNTAGVLKASIHDGVGAGGAGGPQVGVAKYMKVDNWNHRSMVVWAPGEAGPLTNGHQYYVKLVRPDNATFVIYHNGQNEYAGGTGYVNGSALSYDFGITIGLEEYPGSTSVQKIGISSIAVSRGTGSATITWQTSTATTQEYVDFGVSTPYTNREYTTNPAVHSVTLSGLIPNTLYHARITSKASGKRDGRSRDFVFVTDPVLPNMVNNPGFEYGSYGAWVPFGTGALRNYPAGGSTHFYGCKSHSGNWFHGANASSASLSGGCYQTIPVQIGRTLRVRSWLWTYQQDQIGGLKLYTACGRVGIDPTGQTDPNSGRVIWSPYVAAQDLFGSSNLGSWTELAVTAVPTAEHVTIFLKSGVDNSIIFTVYGHDDVVMTQDPEPTYVSSLSGLSSVSDNTYVSIPSLIVTATKAQVGAAYVEQPDRTRGIRVESTDSFTVGRQVTVTGYLGTKVTGERYLFGAQKTDDAAGESVKSMATLVRSVGTGPVSNVGLLMRVAGRVYAGGTGYVYIKDGSSSDSGLKMMTGSLTSPPAVGQFVAVTGIVQLEGSLPAPPPVLWPRSQDDMQVVN